jgi:hypothetical protein
MVVALREVAIRGEIHTICDYVQGMLLQVGRQGGQGGLDSVAAAEKGGCRDAHCGTRVVGRTLWGARPLLEQ